ncbi:lysophospholipid acyltransferase family protein [Nocardioides alcanivorans]|uniref:lysophospholipid acyltransferase family protein n=1 Tax=Nocardioides alcanivorans TaxID=2897352 RepID=UPI001F48207C|nr:lysophospholipid acyltransferase family protein [Nocardioides alcanivorans]
MRVRKLDRPRGWSFVFAASILKPVLFATTKPTWIDGTRIPATGGCIVAVNHMSHLDPLTTAHFVYDHGRLPRYLAKAGLFRNRGLGFFLRAAGQIPVQRQTSEALGAYDAAVAAVLAGECIVVYPEGTLTRDPGLWPMTGKTGAARIALETGCPVIPVAHWGVQKMLEPYSTRPHLFPRKAIRYKAGEPVDLSDLVSSPPSAADIKVATERIMQAITEQLADLRDEVAPAVRFDPRTQGVSQIGNPRKKKRPGDGRSAQ